MALIILPYIFSSGTTIIASQTNSNNSSIINIINGGLDNSNLTGTAGITYANLSLGGNISNADISISAAIAATKINFGTANQGDIFVDKGSGITRLTPGTSGQFLQTQGTSANPQWVTISHGIQIFKSSGTFVASTNIVYLTMIGGGGNGGSQSTGAGGGGGAGQLFINYPYTTTIGNSYTVTINGGASSTIFDTLTASAGSNGGNSSGSTGGSAGSNGGSYGVYNWPSTSGGNNGGGNGGNGASSPFGVGGTGGSPGGTAGSGAANTGAGGGGQGGNGVGGSVGGSGGSGLVIVQY